MGFLLAVLVTTASVAAAAPEPFARLGGQPMGKVEKIFLRLFLISDQNSGYDVWKARGAVDRSARRRGGAGWKAASDISYLGVEAMPVIPFDEFIGQVESVKADSFEGSPLARGADGIGEAEFGAMKAHVLSLYKGVKVAHSFATPDGDVVDCVPIEQQPTLSHPALKGHAMQLTPPEAEPLPPQNGRATAGPKASMVDAQLAEGKLDQFGNEMSCPDGMIPMHRLTLEEMARFKTAQEFFQKTPGGGMHPGQMRARREAEATPSDIHTGHHYGTGAEGVNNIGGSSLLNVWSPTPVSGGFSLSQHWYTGGSFTGNTLQTVEGGWQVFPAKYGTATPRLFIYWTANAYTTTGCYNLDCKAFVQTNKTWVLGGALSPVSTTGGTQYQINMQWKRDSGTGNWWLFLQGSGAQTAVGYYPKRLTAPGRWRPPPPRSSTAARSTDCPRVARWAAVPWPPRHSARRPTITRSSTSRPPAHRPGQI